MKKYKRICKVKGTNRGNMMKMQEKIEKEKHEGKGTGREENYQGSN